MAPIASGTLSRLNAAALVCQLEIAGGDLVVGIFVLWLGGRGVTLMSSQPSLVAGLLVGTVLGVAFFRRAGGPADCGRLVSCLSGSRSQAGHVTRRRLTQPLPEHGDKRGGRVITQ